MLLFYMVLALGTYRGGRSTPPISPNQVIFYTLKPPLKRKDLKGKFIPLKSPEPPAARVNGQQSNHL